MSKEKLYKAFHGKEPDSEYEIELNDMNEVIELGKAIAIEYEVAKHDDKKPQIYRHEFKSGAVVLSNGHQVIVYGEKIKVTERGIIN